jgi:protein-tyrosine phosphatase
VNSKKDRSAKAGSFSLMDQFIDIHAHLIPQFDDGPKSFSESMEMIKIAADQGITAVFATSHFNEYIPPQLEKEYFEKLEQLLEKTESENIPVSIYSGSEIFYHQYVPDTVKSAKVTTLGNWNQYVLLEFPMFQMPDGAEDILFKLTAEKYIPIVAHPERYVKILEKPRRLHNFIRFGGLLQVNGGSILGHFGKDVQKLALQMLEQQMVHFIASDAHSPKGRSFVLKQVHNLLRDQLPEEYLQQLLFENQQQIILKKAIRPVDLPEPENSGFFDSIRKKLKIPFA